MINRSVQHAALLLSSLKQRPGLTLKELCAETGISRHFMEQIGLRLVRAGLIESKRGPGGGYSLAKEEVSLAEILTIFSGKKKLLENDHELTKRVLEAISPINVIA
jgi:Rrf2 family protein